jgi:prolyl-tRNA synthetase
MRFQELHIETRRERPARVQSDGESYLIRAGYLRRHGEPATLGERAITRLHQVVRDDVASLEGIGLAALKAADGEIVTLHSAGDLLFLRCGKCGYVALADMAKARKVPLPPEEPLPLERVATPNCNTIDSLASFLAVSQTRTAKALLYARPGSDELIFVVVRGDMQLSERKLRTLEGALQPATPEQISRAGAVPGYASPIGLRQATIIVDDLIPNSTNLVAGANEAGYHLRNTNCGRDYQAQKVADLTLAQPGNACEACGSPLDSAAGFLLAERGAVLFPSVLQALAEQNHDDRGLCFHVGTAPFDVYLLHIPAGEGDTKRTAGEIHDKLEAAGISVLLDDRDERAGVKFNDADLIGCPLRVIVGARNLADRMVELKRRSDTSSELVPIEEIVVVLRSLTLMPR